MSKIFQQKPLSNLELAEFFNQLSMVLRSGISALEGLTLLLEDSKNEHEKKLLEKMIEEMEQTGYLYEAVSSSGIFPDYAFFMIKLGEETGTLDEVLNGLSEHYTREEHLAETIRNSFVYPSIMLGMMALIIGVLLTKVMPIFHQVFEQLGQEMSGFSAGLLHMGEALSKYSILFVILFIFIISGLFFFRKKLPFYRAIQSQIAVCRFADGMAITLKSGLTPEQGMELTENLIEDSSFKEKLLCCQSDLNNGMDFSAALRSNELFTGTYSRMVSLAGKTGTLDEAMSKISEEYEYNISLKINRMIAMIEPTLVITLSIIVGFILFSVMLPLLGIMSGL